MDKYQNILPLKTKFDSKHLSPIRPRQKNSTIYKHKINEKSFLLPELNNYEQNPQLGSYKTTSKMKQRLNDDVEAERSKMLMMSGRMSEDNPEWMNNSFNFYEKMNYERTQKIGRTQQQKYNVLNVPKQEFHGRNQDHYFRHMIDSAHPQYSQEIATPRKQSFSTSNYSTIDKNLRKTLNWISANQREITTKVGSLERRDYTIKRPLLKIGQNQVMDTYSPF